MSDLNGSPTSQMLYASITPHPRYYYIQFIISDATHLILWQRVKVPPLRITGQSRAHCCCDNPLYNKLRNAFLSGFLTPVQHFLLPSLKTQLNHSLPCFGSFGMMKVNYSVGASSEIRTHDLDLKRILRSQLRHGCILVPSVGLEPTITRL